LLEQGVQRVGADSVQGIELGAGHLHAASLPANGPPEQLRRTITIERTERREDLRKEAKKAEEAVPGAGIRG